MIRHQEMSQAGLLSISSVYIYDVDGEPSPEKAIPKERESQTVQFAITNNGLGIWVLRLAHILEFDTGLAIKNSLPSGSRRLEDGVGRVTLSIAMSM